MVDDAFWNFDRKSINAVRTRQEKDIQASLALPRTSVYGEGATEEDPILDHDQKLKALIKRCCKRELGMNKDNTRL